MVTKKEKETSDAFMMRTLLKKIGPIDMDDVIAADAQNIRGATKYMIKLAGKRVSDNEALGLKKEAEYLRHSRIYKTLTETLRYQVQKRMFKEFSGTNQEIYESGKYLLHAISTLEHIVWSCENPLLLSEQKDMNTSPRKALDKRKLVADNKNT